MDELHLTKKDFKLEWFSGTGKGGQHRNKHQNCCRITHISSGKQAIGTAHRERQANLKDAFTRLVGIILAEQVTQKERQSNRSIVRDYRFEDGIAIDHGSGLKGNLQYVMNGLIDDFIKNRGKYPLPKTGRM